jgi:hypothetical protein
MRQSSLRGARDEVSPFGSSNLPVPTINTSISSNSLARAFQAADREHPKSGRSEADAAYFVCEGRETKPSHSAVQICPSRPFTPQHSLARSVGADPAVKRQLEKQEKPFHERLPDCFLSGESLNCTGRTRSTVLNTNQVTFDRQNGSFQAARTFLFGISNI